ncbi:MAG: tetratricopeptide repeat protein, partial [Bacteroidota bacterium]
MRILLLVTALLIASFFMHAQSYEIESLRKQIKEHPQQDTFRVNRLNDICNVFGARVSYDEMEKFADEALTISRKLKYITGEGYALIGKGRAAYFSGNIAAGMELFEQADSIAKKTSDRTLELFALLRLSLSFHDNRQALMYALKAGELVQALDDNTLLSVTQSFIADCYRVVGDYTNAIAYAMKALKTGEASRSLGCQVRAIRLIGLVYLLIGDYEKSNQYFQKALTGSVELGYNGLGLSVLANDMGENYRLTGKYQEALRQYRLSIAMDSSLYSRAVSECNMADVYVRIDSLQLAFLYAFDGLACSRQIN